MIVGAALIEIHVHGSRSLKEKRGVLQSIKQRVRNRYNVSVAEVDGQDLWQRGVLGLGAVGARAAPVEQVLRKAVAFIEGLQLAEVLASEIEIVELPHEAPQTQTPWGPED